MMPPNQRMTCTPAEYLLLRPGLDRLANALAGARLNLFPFTFGLHRATKSFASLYKISEFDESMAQRIISVRQKLWDTESSRKIRIDEFEISVAALALRLLPEKSPEKSGLDKKLEKYRKRAKQAGVAKLGSAEHHILSEKWKAFLAWTRYYLLQTRIPQVGSQWRAGFWREQRQALARAINSVVHDNFYEVLGPCELKRLVLLAASTLRRGRRVVGLRGLLKAPEDHGDLLLRFVTKRVKLVKRVDAPKDPWELALERADKFRAFEEARRNGTLRPSVKTTSVPAKAVRPTPVSTTNQPARPIPPPPAPPPPGSAAWEDALRNFIGDWFRHTVDLDLRRSVCEQAHFLINNNHLQRLSLPPCSAKTFSSLLTECRPPEDEEPRNWYADWVLSFLIALGRTPPQIYLDVQLGFGRGQKLAKT